MLLLLLLLLLLLRWPWLVTGPRVSESRPRENVEGGRLLRMRLLLHCGPRPERPQWQLRPPLWWPLRPPMRLLAQRLGNDWTEWTANSSVSSVAQSLRGDHRPPALNLPCCSMRHTSTAGLAGLALRLIGRLVSFDVSRRISSAQWRLHTHARTAAGRHGGSGVRTFIAVHRPTLLLLLLLLLLPAPLLLQIPTDAPIIRPCLRCSPLQLQSVVGGVHALPVALPAPHCAAANCRGQADLQGSRIALGLTLSPPLLRPQTRGLTPRRDDHPAEACLHGDCRLVCSEP